MASEDEKPQLIVFGGSRNQELDDLRNSVPQPSPIDDDVEELVIATSRLHVGFLFTAKGFPALRTICKFVLSAEEYCGGWREFAAHLGLDPMSMQCARNSGNLARVCELILGVVAQKEDASLDQVVLSLYKMNRVDAICQCKSSLLDLVDAVLKEHGSSQITTLDDDHKSLLMPPYLPEVPLIFMELPTKKQVCIPPSQPQREENELQRESFESPADRIVNQPQNELQEYAYLVMLTFASDGAEAAKKIANTFRQTRSSDGNRVGVVILQEHSFRVNTFGSQYVLGFFNDVDYVVPVVTKGYVNIVLGTGDQTVDMGTSSLDHKYARYVYQQMQTEYLLKHCVNVRVRPVIVDSYLMQAQREFIMNDALFQSWCSESDVPELANRLMWDP